MEKQQSNCTATPPPGTAPIRAGWVGLVGVCCEASTGFALGRIGGDLVRMVVLNPSEKSQQWEMWSTDIKDDSGHPTFCLVNKPTRKALCHPENKGDYVFLDKFYQDNVNSAMLWSHGGKPNSGYDVIRNAFNSALNLDVLAHAVDNFAHVGMWTCDDGDYMKWSMPNIPI